ncbi:hypothetical protein WMF37_09105 [Sorangium sp. So ce291]|uniref:hypothetical protein n=1 Tax=Sorangium sp. So ce291 TaxID=3133294 RepID=UPI003F62D462
MKTPVVALDAISLVLASTTMTSALAGALAVVQLRAGGDAPARGRSSPLSGRSLRGRSPRVALHRSGADVERWTATRCPGAALAAL